jgi:hypothetical protein
VTKSIKLYSDNPIHDCIDRIIDACVGVDLGDNDAFFYSMELNIAAEELLYLSGDLRRENNDKYRKGIYDKKNLRPTSVYEQKANIA